MSTIIEGVLPRHRLRGVPVSLERDSWPRGYEIDATRFACAEGKVEHVPDFNPLPSEYHFITGDYIIDWDSIHPSAGMSLVVIARSKESRPEIIVKIVRIGCPKEQEFDLVRQRTQREIGALDHNGRLIGFSTLHAEDEDEYVYAIGIQKERGKDIADVIKERSGDPSFYSRESLLRTMKAFRSLLVQLLVFAKRGFTHYDIKPENVVLDEKTDTARIVDFGLARLANDPLPEGVRAGTPNCMSPKQAAGKPDAYCDLRASALTFAHLLHLVTFHDSVDLHVAFRQIMSGQHVVFGGGWMDETSYRDDVVDDFKSTFHDSPAIYDAPIQDFLYMLYNLIQPYATADTFENPYPDGAEVKIAKSREHIPVSQEALAATRATLEHMHQLIQNEEKIVRQKNPARKYSLATAQ